MWMIKQNMRNFLIFLSINEAIYYYSNIPLKELEEYV